MSLFRRVLLSLVTAIALALPLCTFTAPAQAGGGSHQTRHYYVYFRDCPEDPWRYYGPYTSVYYAEYVAYYLESWGYQVFVR